MANSGRMRGNFGVLGQFFVISVKSSEISTQCLTVLTNSDITTIVRREKERETEAMNFKRKYLGSDSR